jgi:O-antigen biosynthesis protein WbqP
MMVGKRLFDLIASGAAMLALSPLLLLIAIAVKLSSRGPALHWSKRIGRDNEIFLMPKFRTMRIDTPQLPTHLLADPERWVTPVGRFIRSTSLDELPQFWSVARGHMSLVGPRPALFNQDDLVSLRTERGLHALRPGITGWAQVNGRDELPIPVKVEYDLEYARRMSFLFDLRVILLTVVKAITGRGVKH